MFLSREIDINYVKIIRKFIYIKLVGLNSSYSANTHQSENDYIPQEPENLRFAHIIIF